MSNKKQQQPYIGKPPTLEGSVPPRYQPPPQPGILKHATQQPPQQQTSSVVPSTSSNLHPKDGKHPQYLHKVSTEGIKSTTQSLDPSKYYPPASFIQNQNSVSQYPPQHPGSIGNQLGIPIQHRQHRIPSTDDDQSNPEHHRLRNFEEDIRRQHAIANSRPHRSSDEAFNRLIPNTKSPEELSQATNIIVHRPPHEDFQRAHIPPHRSQRFTDDELLRLPPVEMLKFVRKSESESARIASEQHRHLQNLVNEIRALKEANQRLGDDNQELRDLCCFLDDDRQKGRKLAREWQRFGRYTASVMRQEVSAYQNKLRELDNKQQELIKDNLELKELCLYLDEERGGSSVCPSCGSATSGGMRDDGDGSSSSTNADEPVVTTDFNGVVTTAPRRSASRERLLHESLARQRTTFNDQTMQYVRSLEQRVKQLEDEKRALQNKMSEFSDGDPNIINNIDTNNPVLSGRPEAVVRALQVLEVREQLEREGRVPERDQRAPPDRVEGVNGSITSDMDDGEKALVREMCNVVWRKLEEAPVPRR